MHSGKYPVPSNESYFWDSYIEFDELPTLLNPKQGFIVSANNKVPPSSYPHLILNDFDWAYPFRAERIIQLIESVPSGGLIFFFTFLFLLIFFYFYLFVLFFKKNFNFVKLLLIFIFSDKIGHTRETMSKIQTDQNISKLFNPLLREVLEKAEGINQLEWKNKLLTTWDGSLAPDSKEAAVYEFWYLELMKLGKKKKN